MLVCHGTQGREWFVRPPCVPDRWFPQDDLDRDSYAFEAFFGSKVEQSHPQKIGADAWFERAEAQNYQIFEHTFPLPNDKVLTLLIFTDEDMMNERDTSRSFHRNGS
jgi:hypothetical protein